MIENLPNKIEYRGAERIQLLQDLDVAGKRVFLRVDFNVPTQDGRVTDDTRIREVLPTIEYLSDKGAKVICASHFGRPKGKPDPKFSLELAASHLGTLCNRDIIFSEDTVGHGVTRQSNELKAGQILVLENLRFNPGEKENSEAFAHDLAKLCDIYINDAFGACHRAHTSTDALPRMIPNRAAGFLLQRELNALGKIANNPERPLISVIGGAKVSDKAKVIDALMVKSSKIIIGGAMAYTFLRALDCTTGDSMIEPDLIPLAKSLLNRSKSSKCEIVLPVDHYTGANFDNPGEPVATENAHIPEGRMALDIGPKTVELFTRSLDGAKSVFWNGPMGVFEKEAFSKGTFALADAIAELPATDKICGGGDSVSAVNKSGKASQFTHISTGGGASLELIEGKALPGVEALKKQK